MPSQTSSKARLRTRSGCSTCRGRKKKCDEIRPICGRCSTASVECTWPELAPDGRQKHSSLSTPASHSRSEIPQQDVIKFSPHAADSWFVPNSTDPDLDDFELNGFMDLMIDWVPEISAAAPEVGDDAWLFEYWHERWLPSLLHRRSNSRYLDFSYMRSMALEFRPLMETALACAALSQYFKESEDPNWMQKMREKALTHQTASIAALRDEMSTGRLDGTEDWFLATITGLTLYDNRDPKAVPAKSVTHVMAVMQLFKARETSKYDPGIPPAQRSEMQSAFERIHYEYLLYHSTIFMIYDPSFDTLVGNSVWTMIELYFLNSPLPFDSRTENWPILGMHYKLFRLIIAISRLGRRTPLGIEDLRIASSVWEELMEWSNRVDMSGDVSVGTLYTMAAKILLEEVLFHQTHDPALRLSNDADIHSCMQLVNCIEVGSHFSRSLIWPLAVLYGSMTAVKDKLLVREKMRKVLEMTDGGSPQSVTDERVDMYLFLPGVAAFVRP